MRNADAPLAPLATSTPPPESSALDVLVPVTLGLIVGTGVGILLGRTVFAPKLPASTVRCAAGASLDGAVRPGGAVIDTAPKSKTTQKQPMADVLAAAPSSINPFALFPGARSIAEVAQRFDVSPRELLTPSMSPLWAPINTPETCADGPRACPWLPPDPSNNHRMSGMTGVFQWGAAGAFMPGGAQWFDAVQGAVPNCHFIAALQAMSMTMPQVLANLVTLAPDGRRQFRLFDGTSWRVFTTDEAVPVFRPTGHTYALTPCATSSRGNESRVVGQVIGWPGVYEKVFAIAGLGVTHDRPDLLLPSYWVPSTFDAAGLPSGTPVPPITAMTGQPTVKLDVHGASVGDFWSAIQSLCNADGMVVAPAHLGTISATEADQWDQVQLVPEHAYSLCGRISQGGRNYVVLRNAWGMYQPSGDGTIQGSWRGRPLGAGGLFALEISRAFNWYSALHHMGG